MTVIKCVYVNIYDLGGHVTKCTCTLRIEIFAREKEINNPFTGVLMFNLTHIRGVYKWSLANTCSFLIPPSLLLLPPPLPLSLSLSLHCHSTQDRY